MLRLVFLALLAFSACLAVSIYYLPWYGTIGVLLGLALLLYLTGGAILKRILMMPFKAKGRVLSGATIEVHGVRPASPPKTELEDGGPDSSGGDPEDAARRWFSVDLTITPRAASGGAFQLWEPGELMLVKVDAKPVPPDGEDEHACRVQDLELFKSGSFVKDEGEKWSGPQRLRLHAGIKTDVKELQLRYYFELFGRVRFDT